MVGHLKKLEGRELKLLSGDDWGWGDTKITSYEQDLRTAATENNKLNSLPFYSRADTRHVSCHDIARF